MFELHQIGFCSVSKVVPIQCEQELMLCCGAELVPKRSQCEHKPYLSYNLQRSLLISKDHLPVRGSVAISAPIKYSDSTRTVSITYPIRNVPLSAAERSSSFPEQKLLRKQHIPSVNRSPIVSGTLSATLSFTIWWHSVNIALFPLLIFFRSVAFCTEFNLLTPFFIALYQKSPHPSYDRGTLLGCTACAAACFLQGSDQTLPQFWLAYSLGGTLQQTA